MFSTLQRQPWFSRVSSLAMGLIESRAFGRFRQRHPVSSHPSFVSNDSSISMRTSLMPPLLAGLAAAVLFALALAFFLTPSKSIGFAPDQYADQQRTRWAGAVRSDAAGRVPIPVEAVERASSQLGSRLESRAAALAEQASLASPTAVGDPLTPVTVPARGIVGIEVLEAPLGAPILLATRIGAEQAAVGFSADGDGPLGAREALAFLQPVATSKPAARRDPVAGRVQQLLNELGYDAGPVDGKPGKQTWVAIERFRQDRSLAGDAPLGVALIDDLERARKDGWLAASGQPLAAMESGGRQLIQTPR